MAKKPYPAGAPEVNPELLEIDAAEHPPDSGYDEDEEGTESDETRRRRLAALGLIRTEDLIHDLKMGKKNLGVLRQYGAQQLGVGKQKFYEIAAVVQALKVEAMVRRACDPEGTELEDGET